MMTNQFKKILILLVIPIFLIASIDSDVFKINKSFDIMGEIFRKINNYYVEDIDSEELMNYAIEGMLSSLDPYTVFIEEKDKDDINYIRYGSYNGLGITVSVKNGALTIVDLIPGFTAHRNGIRIGDKLYKIDSTVIINLPSTELRQFTDGPIGQKLIMEVIRPGINDTIAFNLVREQIKVKNVPFSTRLEGNLGYIKLAKFTKSSNVDFINSLRKLNRLNNLEGLIIDLRDNPGGLLEPAVRICEVFVPKNSLIVTTKGSREDNTFSYKTLIDPIEPELPLIVLINENSASASEILAGALQDLDRAVILGRKSYGKGLVQSIFPLPYNANLKMTTSKYYIPSGRCIQKVNYGKITSKEDNKIFYTKNGRVMEEENGILPDSIIPKDFNPYFIEDLKMGDYLFDFSNIYSSKTENMENYYKTEDSVISKLENYLDSNDYNYNTALTVRLDEVKKLLNRDTQFGLITKITEIKNEVKISNNELIQKNKEKLKKILELESLKRIGSFEDFFLKKLEYDNDVSTAKSILSDSRNNFILKVSEENIEKSKRN